ncbi:MAG: cyclic nucleotide-binding domain-containing protein [Thermoanaerobaculia bacterium]
MAKVKARFKTTSAASPAQRLVNVPAGEYVFRRGEIGVEMYVIHEGQVEILNSGIDSKPLAVLEKGDFFGEMAILEGAPRTASARAKEDCKLVQIDETTFSRLLRKDPETSVRIMRKLSARIRRLEELLLERGAAVPVRSEVTSASQTDEISRVGEPDSEVGSIVSTGPRLVHPGTGVVFVLESGDTSLVGRRDPITGVKPTVDLTPIDPERSCSRQHARIFPKDGVYHLVEDIGTTNGTYLNEDRIGTGVPAPMSAGDKVRFGLVTLEFAV